MHLGDQMKVDLLDSDHTGSVPTAFVSRLALTIGFGGLLLIIALAGIDAERVLQQFQRSDDQIRQRYVSRLCAAVR